MTDRVPFGALPAITGRNAAELSYAIERGELAGYDPVDGTVPREAVVAWIESMGVPQRSQQRAVLRPRTCVTCGGSFESARATAMYCRWACKKAALS